MSQGQNPQLPTLPEAPGSLLPPQKPSDKPITDIGLTIVSHSQLFYYWPLWLVSLVFAGITAIYGKNIQIPSTDGSPLSTTIKIISTPSLGLSYMIILLIVILFTSVNIRGVWAAFVAAMFVIVGLVFSLMGWWRPILKAIGNINFYLNMHFYLWTGIVLFALWTLVTFFYDRRHYIVLRSAQFTVIEEVGEGEKNFDTMGLVLDKQRDNFFQHWLLGFGSGDLKITTAGGTQRIIDFPNVLFVNHKLQKAHEILNRRGR